MNKLNVRLFEDPLGITFLNSLSEEDINKYFADSSTPHDFWIGDYLYSVRKLNIADISYNEAYNIYLKMSGARQRGELKHAFWFNGNWFYGGIVKNWEEPVDTQAVRAAKLAASNAELNEEIEALRKIVDEVTSTPKSSVKLDEKDCFIVLDVATNATSTTFDDEVKYESLENALDAAKDSYNDSDDDDDYTFSVFKRVATVRPIPMRNRPFEVIFEDKSAHDQIHAEKIVEEVMKTVDLETVNEQVDKAFSEDENVQTKPVTNGAGAPYQAQPAYNIYW